MKHLALIDEADRTPFNGKSVQRRAVGRFYTHEMIGRALARQTAERVPAGTASVSVIDPFAGDGRLVTWLVEALASRGVSHVEAALWDLDDTVPAAARQAVEAAGKRVGVATRVAAWTGDTFSRATSERTRWDAVITNPPWELIKPDRREMEMLAPGRREDYVLELKTFDRRLIDDFPRSQPSRRFAGWGTNLSRVGTEVALRLTGHAGVCGVVCPSSLLADATTAALRRWLFEDFALVAATHYPAEARLFDGVDMPCCSFVAVRDARQNGTQFRRVGANRLVVDEGVASLSRDWLEAREYAIPVEFGAGGIALLKDLDRHQPLASLKRSSPDGLWAGRELDETNRASFTTTSGKHPFVRSRHVTRLRPVDAPDEFVDVSRRQIPHTARHTRLVWRDISRPSQTRRIHASLLGPGCVTGNSTSVAYFHDGSLARTLALLALVSSMPFEFQVRSLLMTHHVSLSVMWAGRLPPMTPELVESLSRAAAACLEGEPGAEPRLEVLAARAYDLDRSTWERITAHFSLDERVRRELHEAWC
jgi:Alw26I/Eco31I/Esp3I family type II restriction m6 adenine DNA methyltransferase